MYKLNQKKEASTPTIGNETENEETPAPLITAMITEELKKNYSITKR